MRDEKKWGDKTETEKMGRRDVRQKKWGDKMRDGKKMGRRDARPKKRRDKT